MKWESFHHPDWSLPVVRRRASEQWLDLLDDVGEMLITNGRSLLWNGTYPNKRAYNNAMYRLREAGLVVESGKAGNLPLLKLTPQGRERLPVYHHPEKFWETPWNGIWYMLIFDVPETERHYRDILRGFLKHLRMGCLQKSVWITPRDIRPEYDDLETAAGVHAVSYLLESRTVLHQETAELVRDSWNFEWLGNLHRRYLSVFVKNLQLLQQNPPEREPLMNLLHQESEAYIQCMRSDPLLPNPLLPRGYIGKKVFLLHGKIRLAIASALNTDPE